jgi:hypothetical protein
MNATRPCEGLASSSRVNCAVAVRAQGDEVFLRIVTGLAPPLDVMDLESRQGAAELTTPNVSFKDLLVQLAVGLSIQPNPAQLR